MAGSLVYVCHRMNYAKIFDWGPFIVYTSAMQREEDSPEGVALHAARTALAAAQQQDLDALRRLHASNLERLSRERDEAVGAGYWWWLHTEKKLSLRCQKMHLMAGK